MKGVALDRQLEAWAEHGRERIGHGARERKRLVDERAQPLRRQLLAGGIDGGVVRRRESVTEVIGPNLELASLKAATQANRRSRDELCHEPLLVEPDRRDVAGVVVDPCPDDREPSPGAPYGHVLDDARDRHLLLGQEVGDPALGCRRLVPARRVAQQVVDRVEAELSQTASGSRPHSPQGVERPRERIGTAGCARSRPFRRPIRHGEAGRQPSHRAESREGSATAR